jgi:hypothetical protein
MMPLNGDTGRNGATGRGTSIESVYQQARLAPKREEGRGPRPGSELVEELTRGKPQAFRRSGKRIALARSRAPRSTPSQTIVQIARSAGSAMR